MKDPKDFTQEEKNWMDTITTNYVIAQSDGFQLGYASAISDFTEGIVDYWQWSDDKPQKIILDLLVEMGENLGKRKRVASKNIEEADRRGYVRDYLWKYKRHDEPFETAVSLYTKDFGEAKEVEE